MFSRTLDLFSLRSPLFFFASLPPSFAEPESFIYLEVSSQFHFIYFEDLKESFGFVYFF